MSGWFIGAIDRSPIGVWSIVTGTAVAGYPVSNLGTTYLGNQAQITGRVRFPESPEKRTPFSSDIPLSLDIIPLAFDSFSS